jgi:two-component system response regulator MprA
VQPLRAGAIHAAATRSISRGLQRSDRGTRLVGAIAIGATMQLVHERPKMASRDRRPLVLVVEDDARSAGLLARLLRTDGYDTDVTTDGAAALARLTRDPVPEAVITDFHLPHADGLAIAHYARSRRAGIPIFVVTGYPHSLENVAGWVGDPFVLFTKPLDYAELVRRLLRALEPPPPRSR